MAEHQADRSRLAGWMPTANVLRRVHVALAAAITGLLCGAVGTGLVWSGERGCDSLRGRPTCGGYGLPMLLVIVAVCYVIGAVLLRMFAVEAAGVATFFGVTLPLVVILGLLIDYVFDGWMALALPGMAAVSFVVSVYLARALEAANPSPYADDAASDADESSTRRDGEAWPAVHVHDDLPHYAPADPDS
ncbi:MAG: hypothetical protein WBV37_07550 [Nocardioidaceae bacterium]